MEVANSTFLGWHVIAQIPTRAKPLLLSGPNRHVLIDTWPTRHFTGGPGLVLDLVVDGHPIAHGITEVLFRVLGEQRQVPHVEDALLRIGRMWRTSQPDTAVGLHRKADVREDRVVIVVGELLIGVRREVVAL